MAETIYFGPTEIRLSAGKFRTTRRYIRAVASGAIYALPKDVTASGTFAATAKFRYSANGYVLDTGSGLTFNATVQQVQNDG